MDDRHYMEQAIALARKGSGFTSPNPCVGAVVVNDGQVVGQGWHKGPGLAHAEVNAIDDAGPKSAGATIYVTLEPCNHFGKTPPCTHKILEAGIKRVVIGCNDPNPYVDGGGIQFLRDHGVDVQTGVLEEHCRALIEAFIWYVQNDKKPFVILKCAATLDGRIATSTGDSKWITNALSRQYVHQIRHDVDGILIGSGTLHADNPSLTARRDGQVSKDPARIILDSNLTIDPRAAVLIQKSDAPTILVTGEGVSPEKISRLEEKGATVIQVSRKNGRLELNELMIKLGKLGIQSLLIEGGSRVIDSALKAGIVNKVLFFMAPKILGGDDGIPVCRGVGPKLMKDAFNLSRISIRQFEDDVLIQGYLKH